MDPRGPSPTLQVRVRRLLAERPAIRTTLPATPGRQSAVGEPEPSRAMAYSTPGMSR